MTVLDKTVERVLLRVYRRLGPRYPKVAFLVGAELLFVVWLASLGILSLYEEMSLAEFLRLAAFGFVLQTLFDLVLIRAGRRELTAVAAWLRGERGQEAAARAWRSAAGLPVAYARTAFRYGWALWVNVAWSLYGIWELDLPLRALPILMVGTGLAQIYGLAFLFLFAERVMRPILAEASAELPASGAAETRGVPLRWRLLAVLPAINVITGVAVAGLSGGDNGGIADMGVDVVLAMAVAFTASLTVTVLVADSVVMPVDQLRDASARVRGGDLGARVPVVSTDETGALTRSFNEMTAGLEERERLRDAFGAYVDPGLTERVLEEGIDLAGEEVHASILFLDVRDFTAFAEQAEAHEVVTRLNDLYECVVPIVTKHGGHANKFIGDGMLAVFGAPQRHRDHADRAVAAALEIAEQVRERHRGEIEIGIGVNSGAVLVGTVGGGGRVDFTVIGDPVNTASRVEAATRQTGDEVLVTGETLGCLTRDHGGWDPRPTMELRGKTQPVALYGPRVLARAGRERAAS